MNNDEIEPTVAERYVESCGGIGPLADLSWHPTDENRIVVSSTAGGCVGGCGCVCGCGGGGLKGGVGVDWREEGQAVARVKCG